MKKPSLLFLLIAISASSSYAQIIWSTYSQSYPSGTMDKPQNIGIIATIPEINNSFWRNHPNEVLHAKLAKDTSFQKTRPQEFVAINTFDTTKAQFFLHGVDHTNAKDFEYRITIWPDKIIVPWTIVNRFPAKDVTLVSGIRKMAWLGGYSGDLGDRVVVDVRKKNISTILTSAVVAWEPIKPQLSDIYTASQLDILLKRIARPWENSLTPEEFYNWHKRYKAGEIDNTTGLPKKLIEEPSENNLIFYLSSDIYKKEQLEYELLKNGGVFRQWKANDFDNDFVWLTNLKPGDYLLKMRYAAQRQHVTEYPFLIKTPWYQSDLFKFGTLILIGSFTGFFVVLTLNIKNKRKAEKELSKKTQLQLELKAIYAQLNPHFVFNALSSIQGLINKQDIKGANDYLSDFAKLMRESLNNSNKTQVALKQELDILGTYLKLEQLRFGFRYELNVGENINAYETEIPSLLLQPLIENAVKHGVSGLQDKGMVQISFVKETNNMVVSVTDNGKGFSPDKNIKGFGLKLTYDRIKLLNDLLSGQAISIDIKLNSASGTVVELTFKNWFL